MEKEYIGIDYSLGQANFDRETGIHYGIISANSLMPEALSDFEAIYPETEEENDFLEPIAFIFEQDGYSLQLNDDNTIWVFKSPYFTTCAYCSPCAPGAGDLNAYRKTGVKTYCLDLSWFENNVTPYIVYNVPK